MVWMSNREVAMHDRDFVVFFESRFWGIFERNWRRHWIQKGQIRGVRCPVRFYFSFFCRWRQWYRQRRRPGLGLRRFSGPIKNSVQAWRFRDFSLGSQRVVFFSALIGPSADPWGPRFDFLFFFQRKLTLFKFMQFIWSC